MPRAEHAGDLGEREQGLGAVHFGLGDDPRPLHRVEVTWPASGQQVVLEDVARDQQLVVVE